MSIVKHSSEGDNDQVRRLSIFVAMPYEKPFDEIFNDVLVGLGTAFPGWDIAFERADTSAQKHNLLWLNVQSLISECDLMIADVSGSNPNVMMELGYADARGLTIIILSQEENVPANLQGHLRIRYDSREVTSLRTALKAKISEVLPSTLMRRTASNAIGPGRSLWVENSVPHRSEIPTEALTLREQARAEILSGNLVVARNHLTEAIALAPGAWEARYDLAVVLSRLKYEDDAWSLAMEVAEEAESMADLETAFKAYNLISGIEKRRQKLSEALAAMRKSYELAEQHALIMEIPVHVVVMKNLAVLEVLNDNQSKFEEMIEKLREHPDIQSVLPLLEQEIGHQLLSS